MDSVEVHLLDTATIQIELETEATSLPSPKDPSIQYRIQILQIQPNSSLKSLNTSIHFPQKVKPTIPYTFNRKHHQETIDTVKSIVTAIADSFSMSRLPAPEPTIFSGEPILYPDWKSSFHALIHQKNLPSSDKMYYLKRYVSESAKEATDGHLLQSLSEACERACYILDERFGHLSS